MLVQKQKRKKQWNQNESKASIVHAVEPNNTRSSNIITKVLSDDKPSMVEELHLDEKYRDFHRARQSEKVLKVIRSVLEENHGSFARIAAASADHHKKETNEDRLKETTRLGKSVLSQDEPTITLKDLQAQNENLKSQLCIMYDFLSSSKIDDCDGEMESFQGETVAKERVQKKQHKVGDTTCSNESSATCNDCVTLRQLVTQLKIDCLQERTEKEMLRLNVVKLNECFGAVQKDYALLTDKMEDMEVSFKKRLNKADDDLHKIKHNSADKKKSFFRRKLR